MFMDWQYLSKLFKGIFYNTYNIFFSIPTYLSILPLVIWLWPGIGGKKMKSRLKKLRKYFFGVFMCLLMVSIIFTSHSLYVNKPSNLKLATPDELTQSVLRDRDIRLSDLTREDFRIRNKTFINCHIYGPAIIYPTKQTVLYNLKFVEITTEGGLIITTNKSISGAVSFEGCVLQDCTLHKISFIGSKERIAAIKSHSNLKD
jgi:hypothetical protein